jgi:hypothetical protein
MLESLQNDVLEKQAQRLNILLAIYQISGGIPTKYVYPYSDEEKFGLRGEPFIHILEHLEREGLIKAVGSLWGGQPAVQITHQGIIECEAVLRKPTESTEHFLTSAINLIMKQTNIYAGRDATGNIIASEVNAPITNTISNQEQIFETSAILQAISELRQQINTLPQNLQDIAEVAIDDLQEEVSNPTKPAKLRTLWMNICNIVGKAKDPIVFANAAFSLQEHLSKLNIDISDIRL